MRFASSAAAAASSSGVRRAHRCRGAPPSAVINTSGRGFRPKTASSSAVSGAHCRRFVGELRFASSAAAAASSSFVRRAHRCRGTPPSTVTSTSGRDCRPNTASSSGVSGAHCRRLGAELRFPVVEDEEDVEADVASSSAAAASSNGVRRAHRCRGTAPLSGRGFRPNTASSSGVSGAHCRRRGGDPSVASSAAAATSSSRVRRAHRCRGAPPSAVINTSGRGFRPKTASSSAVSGAHCRRFVGELRFASSAAAAASSSFVRRAHRCRGCAARRPGVTGASDRSKTSFVRRSWS